MLNKSGQWPQTEEGSSPDTKESKNGRDHDDERESEIPLIHRLHFFPSRHDYSDDDLEHPLLPIMYFFMLSLVVCFSFLWASSSPLLVF